MHAHLCAQACPETGPAARGERHQSHALAYHWSQLLTRTAPVLSANITAWRDYGISAAQQAATDPAGHHAYGWGLALVVTLAIVAVIWLLGETIVSWTDVSTAAVGRQAPGAHSRPV